MRVPWRAAGNLQADANRILLAAVLGVAGCALLGAGLAAGAVAWLTTPPSPCPT